MYLLYLRARDYVVLYYFRKFCRIPNMFEPMDGVFLYTSVLYVAVL